MLPRAARSATSCWRAGCRRRGDPARSSRAAPRSCASRRRWRSPSKLVRSGADAHRHRGHGGGRPYRAGLDQRAGAGDPAAYARGAGVRRRRHRPRRGDARLSRDGRLRRAARHPLRLRHANRSPIRASSRPSSAPRRATPCRRSQLDPRFPVIPVRALANDGDRSASCEVQREVIDRFDRGELTQKAAQLEIEHFWAGALRRAVIDGDVENGSLMAGPERRHGDARAERPPRSSRSWSTRRSRRCWRAATQAPPPKPRLSGPARLMQPTAWPHRSGRAASSRACAT